MKKFFKILGIVLVFLLILIFVLPFAFKGKIIEKVKQEANNSLNAKVDFTDYSLSLFRSFPNFNLGLDNLSIVGVEEFEEDTLANVKNIYLAINLFSVINGDNYEIKSIKIDEPNVLLKVLDDGTANWEHIQKESETPDEETPEDNEESAFKLELQKLIIKNGNIIYDDAEMGVFVEALNLNHKLKGDLTADFTSLKTKTDIEKFDMVYGGIKYMSEANINLDADIDADLANSKYTFKENELKLNELFLGFDGWFAMSEEGYDMDITFEAKKNEFKNFLSLIPAVYSKDFDDIETKGKLSLDGYAKGVYKDDDLPAFKLNINVEDAMFKYPDLPSAVTNIAIKGNVRSKGGSADNTIIDIPKIHFNIIKNPIDLKLLVKTPVSDPDINAQLKGKINLTEIKQVYPLEEGESLSGMIDANLKATGRLSAIENEQYEKFEASGKLAVSNIKYKSEDFPQGMTIHNALFAFSPQFVELSSFSAKFGKSDLKASGRIDNIISYVFKDELLKGSFKANSNLLDLNEFMTDEDVQETESSESESYTMSVVKVPANIDFGMNVNVNKVLYDNLEMTNVLGTVKIVDEKMILDKLSLDMLKGNLVVSGSYDTKNSKKPIVDFNMDINEFDIQKSFANLDIMKKLAPIAEKTWGSYSTKMKLNTALDEGMNPIYSSMTGLGLLSTSSITIKNSDLLSKIANVLKIDKLKQFDIQKVLMNFKFKDGRINFEPFDVKMKNITANIGGDCYFDQKIDYKMNLQIPKSEFGGKANQVLSSMISKAKSKGIDADPGETISVDMFVGGTVTDPKITSGLKGAVENTIENIKEEIKEEVIETVKKEAGKLVEQAQKKADKLLADARVQADKIRREAKIAGDKVVAEAKVQGDQLVKKAKNPLAKAAAKKSAQKLVKEAEKKSQKMQSEADKKANAVVDKAKANGDKLINEAREKSK